MFGEKAQARYANGKRTQLGDAGLIAKVNEERESPVLLESHSATIGGELVIETERFLLRPLVDDDVTEKYLEWFNDIDVKKWIVSAESSATLEKLRSYVGARVNRTDILFLGIFVKGNSAHIGNIKYEPIFAEKQVAEMGVLVGDKAYRGSGVFAEVLSASSQWLKNNRGIVRITLGVDRRNLPARKAYEKSGFVLVDEAELLVCGAQTIKMVLAV